MQHLIWTDTGVRDDMILHLHGLFVGVQFDFINSSQLCYLFLQIYRHRYLKPPNLEHLVPLLYCLCYRFCMLHVFSGWCPMVLA